jgi:hypothetical protein
MVHGRCNCGKKATTEWLVQDKKMAWCLKFCDKCSPKIEKPGLQKIYWNIKKLKPNLRNS